MKIDELDKGKILVTGSSGYVGDYYCREAKLSGCTIIGIDKREGAHTDIVANISDVDLLSLGVSPETIVHCAAARFDYGIKSDRYYKENVSDTIIFLERIQGRVGVLKHFIHLSSVAAFDGQNLNFSSELNSDDAYRSTKYSQEKVIEAWCKKNSVPLTILYPSAIYDEQHRFDTNVGKLLRFVNFFKIFPDIKVKKSVTYLPNFVRVIELSLKFQKTGRILCIDQPVQTVSEMIKNKIGTTVKLIKVPGLKAILFILSLAFEYTARLFKVDPILSRNRVTKLFKDTSYHWVASIDADLNTSFFMEASRERYGDEGM